jgi:hypothetical protein
VQIGEPNLERIDARPHGSDFTPQGTDLFGLGVIP